MDEMKIVSEFTSGFVSKIASFFIRKKTGYDINIQLNEVTATVNDGKAKVHLDLDATMEKEELLKLLKTIGLN